jgi:hypothetical protein
MNRVLNVFLLPLFFYFSVLSQNTYAQVQDMQLEETENVQPEEIPSDDSSVIVIDESDDIAPVWNGVLGPLKIGLMIGAEIPSFLHYSLETRFLRYFGVSVGFGSFNRVVDKISLNSRHWDIRARYFPFSGSLYLGAAFGVSKLKASIFEKISLSELSTDSKVSGGFSRVTVTPMFGWHWIWDSGFNVNLSAGWQMALSNKSSVNAELYGLTKEQSEGVKNSETYQRNLKKVKEDVVDRLSGMPLPHLGLGIGWMI